MVTTLVSSTLLGKMAAAAGVHYAETFTGFKWIGQAVLDHPDWRFVFGYEQALGYLVDRPPARQGRHHRRVLLAEVAALAKADGVTLQDRLDDIAERFGRHVTAERSVPVDPPAMPALMAQLRADAAGDAGRRRGHRRAGRSPRPTSCGSTAATAPGCRSARAAPSRR